MGTDLVLSGLGDVRCSLLETALAVSSSPPSPWREVPVVCGSSAGRRCNYPPYRHKSRGFFSKPFQIRPQPPSKRGVRG